MVYKVTQKQHASTLFEGWQETMIWSCMQGVMIFHENWKGFDSKYKRGLLKLYAQHAVSSMKGAYMDESYEG